MDQDRSGGFGCDTPASDLGRQELCIVPPPAWVKQQCGPVWHCMTAASVLLCPADGSSLPSHVSHNAGILSFHKVSRSDSGNYTCIASNRPQGEIRATVQLVVAGEGSVAGRGVSCCAGLAWVAPGVPLQRKQCLAWP